MKKTMFVWLFCIVSVYILGQDVCWYFEGQKGCRKVSDTKLYVRFEKLDETGIKSLIENMHVGNLKEIYYCGLYDDYYIIMQHTSQEDIWGLVRKLNENKDVVYASPVFWDDRGLEGASYTNEIIVSLKSKEDYPVLLKCAEDYQINDVKYIDLLYAYILTLPHNPQKDAMEIALELYETGLFEYAEPNFITFWPIENWPFDTPDAIPQIKYESNLIYPNPVSDMLFIDLDRVVLTSNNVVASYNIMLYNSQGNMLHQAKATNGIVRFDVSTFPAGIYFLHIHNGISATSETFKIFVKH